QACGGAPLERTLDSAVGAAVRGERRGADRLDVIPVVFLGEVREPVKGFLSWAPERFEQQLAEPRGVGADLGGAGEESPGLARGVDDPIFGLEGIIARSRRLRMPPQHRAVG